MRDGGRVRLVDGDAIEVEGHGVDAPEHTAGTESIGHVSDFRGVMCRRGGVTPIVQGYVDVGGRRGLLSALVAAQIEGFRSAKKKAARTPISDSKRSP